MKAISNRIRQSASTRRGKTIIAGILLVLAIMITLAIVYWNAIKKQLIRDQVKLKVREKTERLYNIHYDNMELNEVAGNLSISNLTLQYDSGYYPKRSCIYLPVCRTHGKVLNFIGIQLVGR